MVTLIQGPLWFFGGSIAISAFSAILLAMVAILGTRFYHVAKDKKWFMFSTAFAFMAISFLGQSLLTYALQAKGFAISEGGLLTMGVNFSHTGSTLFFLGLVGMRFLLLYGLFLLYSTYREQPTKTHAFVLYLLGIMMYFTTDYFYVFDLTALVLMLIVTTEYFIKYRERKHVATRYLAWSFAVLSLSRFLFVIVPLNTMLFVLADVIQALGFLLLLLSLIKVRYYGKKVKA